MAKSKKKRQQDFQKVKLKVGKKLKSGDNVTNASFKTRSIQISQKLKAAKVTGPSTKKKRNIQEVLVQCRHYNGNVRHEAVIGIREIVSTYPEIMTTHLSDILEKSSELLSDKDGAVRQGSLRLFKLILLKIKERQISPFFSMVCAHLCCAMTHISTDIQMDSLIMFDLLLEHYPKLIITEAGQVMTNFVEQISRQQGEGQRSLSTNLGHSMTSMKWRTSVLGRIEKFFIAFLNFHSDKQSDSVNESNVTWFKENEQTHVHSCPKYIRDQWENPGFVMRSFTETADSSDDLDNKFSRFVDMLVPLLLECWIEGLPSVQASSGSDSTLTPSSVEILSSILNVTKLLLECVERLQLKRDGQTWHTNKTMKDFQHRLMIGFPYSSQEFMCSLPGKKVQDDQVSVAVLNVSVCEIMTYFVPNCHDYPGSHPRWLASDVLPYVHDFLSMRGQGKGTVGSSCKNVIRIITKILKAGTDKENLSDIMSAMFTRFKGASYLSQEKKVYLKFFSDIVFSTNSSDKISDELQYKFLQCLPELFPRAAKENPTMAALLIKSMKVAACRNCLTFLDSGFFLKRGLEWFGEKEGAIVFLSHGDQRDVFSLLYFVQEIDINLIKLLTNLVRSEKVTDVNVSYLIHILHNRFSKSSQMTKECSLFISFLVNLLLGNTQNIDQDAMSVSSGGKYCLIDTQPGLCLPSWARHEFLVQEVLKVISMSGNAGQVKSIILNFLRSFMQKHSKIALQSSFGICNLASRCEEMPSDMLTNLVDLSLSILMSCVKCDLGSDVITLNSIQTAVIGFLENKPDAFYKFVSDVKTGLTEASTEENSLILLKVCLVVLREESRMNEHGNSKAANIFKEIVDHVKTKEEKSTELEGLIADLEYRCSTVG